MIRYSAQKVKNKTAILYFIVFRLKEKLAPTVSITHYMKKQHIPTFSYIFSQDKKHEISSKSNGQTSTMSISCSRENRNETALSRVQRESSTLSADGQRGLFLTIKSLALLAAAPKNADVFTSTSPIALTYCVVYVYFGMLSSGNCAHVAELLLKRTNHSSMRALFVRRARGTEVIKFSELRNNTLLYLRR